MSLSRVRLFVTPWTVAYQASPSMGFSRQEYWSGLPFPSLGDFPDPGIEPRSPALQADALPSELPGKSKKDLHDPDNHSGVITHLVPDILECEVKWALGSITMNKASGGDGIPVELFQILKDDAVKVLHSTCQQTWKTQQWPQDWKRSVFIPIPKKGMPKNAQVQFSSVTQPCLTLCNPMNRSTPGLPVQHQLLEFTQTHVHQVSDAIQPSHPLSSPSPPAFNLSQHQDLFQ